MTQSYTAIPKNLRRQKKQVFMWYPAEKSDFKLVNEETNIIPDGELQSVRDQLRSLEHGYLHINLKSRDYKVVKKKSAYNKWVR